MSVGAGVSATPGVARERERRRKRTERRRGKEEGSMAGGPFNLLFLETGGGDSWEGSGVGTRNVKENWREGSDGGDEGLDGGMRGREMIRGIRQQLERQRERRVNCLTPAVKFGETLEEARRR